MPKLFQVDPYDECLAEEIKYTTNAYCIVEVYVQPNQSNDMWRSIEKFSHPWKSRYRHDHLVYGVCINRCHRLLEKIDLTTRKKFHLKIPEIFTEPFIDPFAFDHAIEDSLEFGDVINHCINYDLMLSFGLKAYTMVQYCKVKGRLSEIGNSLDFRNVYGIDRFVSFQTSFIRFLLQ